MKIKGIRDFLRDKKAKKENLKKIKKEEELQKRFGDPYNGTQTDKEIQEIQNIIKTTNEFKQYKKNMNIFSNETIIYGVCPKSDRYMSGSEFCLFSTNLSSEDGEDEKKEVLIAAEKIYDKLKDKLTSDNLKHWKVQIDGNDELLYITIILKKKVGNIVQESLFTEIFDSYI